MVEARVWSVVVVAGDAARALGEPSHIRQVRAFGLARSRAAFARALIASGLFSKRDTERAVSSFVADYGGETGSPRDIATAMVEGQVFVCPAVLRTGDPVLAWPAAPAQTTGRASRGAAQGG